MKLFLSILIILFFSSQRIYSQEFSIVDSLKNKTFKELYDNIILCSNTNDAKEKIYATAYLHKAKNEKDTIKMATAYANFVYFTNSEAALKYCDSIIAITKNKNYSKYPGYGYMLKGVFNYRIGSYEDALENYIIAYKYATKNKNLEQQLYINNRIGGLKNLWGNYDEGLQIFKNQFNLFNKLKTTLVDKDLMYIETLFNLSNSYLLTNQLDSSLYYSKIGLQESLKLKNEYYYSFIGQSGEILYLQKKYEMALDSLEKALPQDDSFNALLNNHYYQGQIYSKQHQREKAFYHFNKADSIYTLSNDVVPEVRNIQEYLLKYYKNNNDTKNQLKYIDRLLHVDSIIITNYKNLNETIVKEYDTPLLFAEKEKIIATLKVKESKFSTTIIGLTILVISILLFFTWYYLKQRILNKRFKELMETKQQIAVKKTKEKSVKKLNDVSEKIVNSILSSLEEFEINQDFLENKITLNSLSKKFETNSNYLSKIINTYKEKNFSTYISDLRINYCIEKLKADSTFRKYTITAIAFEIGFNNVESFSNAFYKNTGMNPSYFIKNIQKNSK